MRILQLCNKVPWPPKDGGAIATLTLTKGFSLLGHQVSMLAMNTNKHHTNLDEIPESLRTAIDFKLIDVPAEISIKGLISNLLFSDLPYNAARFINQDFSLQLIQILKDKTFDIIQLEGLYLCPYIPLIRQHSNAKIAYRSHNIEYEIWERGEKLAKGFKRIYLNILKKRLKRFELSYLNAYDLLVSITDRDGKILDELGNTKARHTSQTGIDFSSLIPNAKNLEYPSLFHLGALDWAPNQEGILWFINNCWAKLRELHPHIKLYIAGRNAPEWFEKKLKVEGIQYLGEVEDGYEFMNSKAIMVVPLHSGSGMRIKIIEGMALGKAIVSTSIGSEGIPTTSGKNIKIANTPDLFIDSISELITDKPSFEAICKNSVDFIHENFDNLVITGSLVDFYKQQINA